MHTVPQRSAFLQLMAVFGAFVGGPVAGITLAASLAPDSSLVPPIAAFAFALAFVLGLVLWFGAGVFSLARASWRRRNRPSSRRALPAGVEVPPGYRGFVWLGLALPMLAGACVGAASDHGFLRCIAAFSIAGLAYGLAVSKLAHHGYLPFPEPE